MRFSVLERLQLWWGTLSLQAVWGYRRMQGCGWLLMARIGLRKSGSDQPLSDAIVQFNTHTLLASLLTGAAIGELRKPDGDVGVARNHLLKWMGTFGALGDLVYWQGMAWNCIWMGVAAWWLAGAQGVVLFAGMWVAVEVLFRIGLFEYGLRGSENIARAMRFLANQRVRQGFNRLGIAGMGFVVGYGFKLQPTIEFGSGDVVMSIAMAGGAILSVMTRFQSLLIFVPLATWWLIALGGMDIGI